MPDTIRSLSDLNNLFADNTQGVISPQDIRDLMVSLMVHGEIGSGAKTAITINGTFAVLDFTLAGVVGRGITADTVNKRLSGVPVVLKPQIDFELDFNGATNTTYEAAVFVNGVQNLRLTAQDRIVSAAQIGHIRMSSSIQVQAGDFIDARIRSLSGTPTFTLLRGVLRLRRIGVE